MGGQKHRPPTLAGIASMMGETGDQVAAETGALLAYIGDQHQHPVTCRECAAAQDDGPCLMLEMATAIGIAWLMQQAAS